MVPWKIRNQISICNPTYGVDAICWMMIVVLKNWIKNFRLPIPRNIPIYTITITIYASFFCMCVGLSIFDTRAWPTKLLSKKICMFVEFERLDGWFSKLFLILFFHVQNLISWKLSFSTWWFITSQYPLLLKLPCNHSWIGN